MSTRYSGFTPAVGQMNRGGIRAAWPVAAEPLKATGRTVNWLLGRGNPLVIDGGHTWTGSGAQVRTLNYRYQVDDVHLVLGATFVVSTFTGGFVTIAGTEYYVGNAIPVVIHVPFPNLAGNGEVSWIVFFEWDGDAVGALSVHQVSLYECPQIMIDPSGSSLIETRSPIYNGRADFRSITGLARAVEDLQTTYFRRGALFNWAKGGANGFQQTSTTYVDLFTNVLPAMQTRHMYEVPTVRACKCNVYARVSSGTGQVQLEMTNGDTATFNVTSTDDTWHSTQNIDVKTDNKDAWESTGGAGSVRDELQVRVRNTSGGSITLRGVSIWDPPGD